LHVAHTLTAGVVIVFLVLAIWVALVPPHAWAAM